MLSTILNNIFSVTHQNFPALVETCFHFQYQYNPIYNQWCHLLQSSDVAHKNNIETIPYLPISFFKTKKITTTEFNATAIFESSGTTQTINSKHFVKDIGIYESSFLKAFTQQYGNINQWCIVGLLPSYLERNNSSLVVMVQKLIELSNHPKSGFYLNNFQALATTLTELEAAKQPTLLIGVTFALLDFAEQFPMQLQYTNIMETGGMKGRRRELIRDEVHELLQLKFGVQSIHSEYGMTELLSQAYSKGNGRFTCPPWMKILVRNEEDPLQVSTTGRGILNVIDLANIYSCCFIATEDAGIVYEDGSFEVLGRVDNSDIRGCSLMVS
ncbi:MAG: acyl transferase [Chitinophagaceae bacterium]